MSDPALDGIPCLWMRGGTSKGAYFLASDLPADLADGIDDSKRVPPPRRRELAAAIHAVCRVGLGCASVAEIDRLNNQAEDA